MKHNINTFLKTDLGKIITWLTKAAYYNLPKSLNLKVQRYQSKFSHMNVDFYDFEDYNVFVFQGTHCIFDWIADLKMALGIKPRQFKLAVKYVKVHMDESKPTYIAGHSLGGAITEYVVHKLNSDNVIGITYNGAGTKHLLKERTSYNVFNYVSEKDILNRLTMKMPFSYFKHIGQVLIIEDEYSRTGLQAHGNFFIFK